MIWLPVHKQATFISDFDSNGHGRLALANPVTEISKIGCVFFGQAGIEKVDR
jgi:hypothetical protein